MTQADIAKLRWFDEEGIDMHIFGSIGKAPVDSFDDHEVAKEIPIKGVEEKKAPFF